jgi:2,4-dienoyl-CoA reductase-like NADH-dependent reductase (Old Yellow Enzyme family)/NADPH-dependent 2,4-dienoyl-CoA reductase/sulfur reductase-like enzyme
METLFESYTLGGLKLRNRFVLAPIKTAFGNVDGSVTERQLVFYRQIAENGPALLILEPAAVTPDGREHPRQLTVHRSESAAELQKITTVIHQEGGLACLHLNHGGGAANPKASGTKPLAPSVMNCPSKGQTAEPLTEADIARILTGYRSAAKTAEKAGFDCIEIQAGHGYLLSQFMNGHINRRQDRYGVDRLLFVREVLSEVRQATALPLIVRISGDEMAPENGLDGEDLAAFFSLAEDIGVIAVHVGMGSVCYNPPWYFHHGRLPEQPQLDALSRVRRLTRLPVIAAGRMGRPEKVRDVLQRDLADMIALGRPLLADPDLVEKWRTLNDNTVNYCGYCLQGCLQRMKSGQPIGCNLNPELAMSALSESDNKLKVLVVGGGPAGMSAAKYLTRRGHQVNLVERNHQLGGQFALAWQAPGKQAMKAGLVALEREFRQTVKSFQLGHPLDLATLERLQPDLMVWATGAIQNIPDIEGLDEQTVVTSLDFFAETQPVTGPRVLVIGAGRTGLEIVEKLGKQGYEVVATKRTDPIGAGMDAISLKLTLKQIETMPNVTLMARSAVRKFSADSVTVVQEGQEKRLKPFQTVILASGLRPAPSPETVYAKAVPRTEIIGDAAQVQDIFTAVRSGYELASRY